MTHNQVLRNSQTYLKTNPICKAHLYLLAIIRLMILISSIWQATQRKAQDFSTPDSDVQSIHLNSHQPSIGNTQSIDQILIFNLKSMNNTNDSIAVTSLEQFNDQDSEFMTRNNVNKT